MAQHRNQQPFSGSRRFLYIPYVRQVVQVVFFFCFGVKRRTRKCSLIYQTRANISSELGCATFTCCCGSMTSVWWTGVVVKSLEETRANLITALSNLDGHHGHPLPCHRTPERHTPCDTTILVLYSSSCKHDAQQPPPPPSPTSRHVRRSCKTRNVGICDTI